MAVGGGGGLGSSLPQLQCGAGVWACGDGLCGGMAESIGPDGTVYNVITATQGPSMQRTSCPYATRNARARPCVPVRRVPPLYTACAGHQAQFAAHGFVRCNFVPLPVCPVCPPPRMNLVRPRTASRMRQPQLPPPHPVHHDSCSLYPQLHSQGPAARNPRLPRMSPGPCGGPTPASPALTSGSSSSAVPRGLHRACTLPRHCCIATQCGVVTAAVFGLCTVSRVRLQWIL